MKLKTKLKTKLKIKNKIKVQLKKNLLILLIFFLLPFSLVGQEVDENQSNLIFGVFPYLGVNQIVKTYAPLKRYIEENYDVDVVIVSASSFEKFVARTSKGEYDLIFTAPHFALKAEREFTYERLARFSGDIEAQLVVQNQSPVRKMSELGGRIIYSPDPLAIISILGESMLSQTTPEQEKVVTIKSKFSHRNVLLSVAKERNVAGLVSSNVMQRFMSGRSDLRIIESSKKIPSAMFMLNAKLSEDKKQKLKILVNNFPNSPGGKGFFNSMPFEGLQDITDEDMQILTAYSDRLEQMLN